MVKKHHNITQRTKKNKKWKKIREEMEDLKIASFIEEQMLSPKSLIEQLKQQSELRRKFFRFDWGYKSKFREGELKPRMIGDLLYAILAKYLGILLKLKLQEKRNAARKKKPEWVQKKPSKKITEEHKDVEQEKEGSREEKEQHEYNGFQTRGKTAKWTPCTVSRVQVHNTFAVLAEEQTKVENDKMEALVNYTAEGGEPSGQPYTTAEVKATIFYIDETKAPGPVLMDLGVDSLRMLGVRIVKVVSGMENFKFHLRCKAMGLTHHLCLAHDLILCCKGDVDSIKLMMKG
uniref:Uncharacterized protein n=1 Tax=Chenopodium quinoa TaxID=63459 RepID=A0A803N2I7_CHEQI